MTGSVTMKYLSNLVILLLLLSCEKPIEDTVLIGSPDETDADANVSLRFTTDEPVFTRTDMSAYISRLNIQLFDGQGTKVFDRVKTQTSSDSEFASLSLQLEPGTYTVVAVGHSSPVSATIKSPQLVQFTAQSGRKLSDTFCFYGSIVCNASPVTLDCNMRRVSAMFHIIITDEDIPSDYAQMRFDYTGGSANFNPTTQEGCTKSNQSELFPAVHPYDYQIYTFPYMAATGKITVTATALNATGATILQRRFVDVPVTRGVVTTYTGQYFGDAGGVLSQTGFYFTVDTDWKDTLYIHY